MNTEHLKEDANVTTGVNNSVLPLGGGALKRGKDKTETLKDPIEKKKPKLTEASITPGKRNLSAQEHWEEAQGHAEDMKHPEADSEYAHKQYQFHMGMHHLKKAAEAEKHGALVTAGRHKALAKDFGVLRESWKPEPRQPKKDPVTAHDMSLRSEHHADSINDQNDLSQAEHWTRKMADAHARKDKKGVEEAKEKLDFHLNRHLINIQHAELSRHYSKMHHMIRHDNARAAGNHKLADTHLAKAKEFNY